jgi:phosphoribosylformimino-5-aminoimidazole carboxamide ribotide isomerase
MAAVDLAAKADSMGVGTIIYTDTATDGMMRGTNTCAVESVCERVGCSVIASGGITSVADIERLRDLGRPNLAGAIVGKALYEGVVSLRELSGAAADA